METSVKRQGEWAVVKIKGRIQMEKTWMFREACLKSLTDQKVVFVLDNLQFVGSTGITEFFNCLTDVQNMNGCGVHLVGLSQDFKRFVSFTSASQLKVHETLEEVFQQPALPAERPPGWAPSLEASPTEVSNLTNDTTALDFQMSDREVVKSDDSPSDLDPKSSEPL